MRIDPKVLHNNKVQPDTRLTDAALAGIAKQISENGWIDPIVIQRQPDGSLVIIDGHRRHAVAMLMGLQWIMCYLVPDEESAETMFVVLDAPRRRISNKEKFMVWAKADDRDEMLRHFPERLRDGITMFAALLGEDEAAACALSGASPSAPFWASTIVNLCNGYKVQLEPDRVLRWICSSGSEQAVVRVLAPGAADRPRVRKLVKAIQTNERFVMDPINRVQPRKPL